MNRNDSKAGQSKLGVFWKGVKAEFKKISWPNKDRLFRETVVVLVSAISIGVIIVLVDWLLNFGLSFIW